MKVHGKWESGTHKMVIKTMTTKRIKSHLLQKKQWHDAESVNTQETTLRRDSPDVEEAALDEEYTATRASLRHSESMQDSDTGDF